MDLKFFRSLLPDSQKPLGGHYKIVNRLGAGGFGQTFLAQDLHLPGQPTCVVKQLKPQARSDRELQVARRLFDTEAQVLYRLGNHPQIPKLLAHFEDANEFYLVQELVNGQTLDYELSTGRPWDESQVMMFLQDVLDTLAFVHRHRVIHRDLKPSNLIRRQHDGRVVLIDFGAVKQASTQVVNSTGSISHTISIGTQGYMPNEQLAGRPQFSSDLYAVGVMMIQALTGRHPAVLTPDAQTGELDWHSYRSDLSSGLRQMLDIMVRYDFRSRYSTADEALAAVQALAPESSLSPGQNHTPVSPSPPSVYPTPPPSSTSLPTPSSTLSHPTSRPTPSRPTSRPTPPATAPTMAVIGQHGRIDSPAMSMATDIRSQPKRRPWTAIAIATTLGVVGLVVWRACMPAPTAQESASAGSTEEPATSGVVRPSDVQSVPVPGERSSTSLPATDAAPDVAPDAVPDAIPDAIPDAVPDAAPDADDPSEPLESSLTPEIATNTVEAFYDHISTQSWDTAHRLTGGTLAQQYSPDFFRQFQSVSIENIQVTAQAGKRVELLGQNTYVYSDGSSQTEDRTYTVKLIEGQPKIVSSDFVRVVKSRS